MSYEENKISDLIDKGLHEQEQLFLSCVNNSVICDCPLTHPDSDKECCMICGRLIYEED